MDEIIEDCKKAFEFIFFYLKKFANIEINEYILMGDSAGALLSMNLLNYLIRKRYKKPLGLIMIYPCN